MEIKPFKAFRFDPDVVGDVGKCIAPPYDVITDSQRDRLYRRSKYSIVRIAKGKIQPSDNGQHNQYTRAAQYLKTWVRQGALRQDGREAIYGYVQDFEIAGATFRRFSFISLARLEEFGPIVRPHEQVFEKPVTDRLNLYRATGARFGLIFMLYEDPHQVADRIIARVADTAPLLETIDDEGTRHHLFAITDENDIRDITAMMRDKSCIIADGHHRYTTGLILSRENRSDATQYQMLAFANTCQKGLVVLATHRLVGNLKDFDGRRFLQQLQQSFTITEYPFGRSAADKNRAQAAMLTQMNRELGQNHSAFGMYLADGRFYVAALKDPAAMDRAAPDKCPAWRTLDVSVLQTLVFRNLLHLTEDSADEYVDYVKGVASAVGESTARVDTGRRQVAFFLNPVKLDQLSRVTDSGERMPHKSTYFYPKMYTGLTIQIL